MDDEIDALYRMYFNLAIQSVTKKAIANGYTVEEIMDELEREMHLLADNIPNEETERFVRIMREEATNFTQQLTVKYKDVNTIMEEIGWT